MKIQAGDAPTMRQFFATAHALNLQAHAGGSYRDHPIPTKEGLGLFEVIEQLQRAANALDPVAVVDESGLPFIQALLRAEKPLPLSWIEGWIERNGADTLFVGAKPDEQPLNYWIEQRLLPNLDSAIGRRTLALAEWLIVNSPDWDPARASRWTEKLRAVKASEADNVRPLIELCETRGLQVLDTTRCQERWLTSDQVGKWLASAPEQTTTLLSQPVSCLSGRVRSLGELLSLRTGLEAVASYFPLEDTVKAELPHKRRDDLANRWILDTDISIDEARGRVWACFLDKPEALDVVFASYVRDKRDNPARADRFDQIMMARDQQGRSLTAYLEVNKQEHHVARLRNYGWAFPDDAFRAGDGAGLLEQCLFSELSSYRHGQGRSGFSYPSDRPIDATALGPVERFDGWVDLVIDTLSLPASHWGSGNTTLWGKVAEALPASPARARLSEALDLNRLNRALLIAPSNGHDYPNSDKESKNLNEQLERSITGLRPFLKNLKNNGLRLSVGVEEWRQWALQLGRAKKLESKPSWMGSSYHSFLKETCDFMDMRTLEQELERAAIPTDRVASPRGMRL